MSYIKNFYISLFACLVYCFLSGHAWGAISLKERLGEDLIGSLNQVTMVVLYDARESRIAKDEKDEVASKARTPVNVEIATAILSLLRNERSYLLELQKQAFFVPHLGLTLSDDKGTKVDVLFSSTARQMRFHQGTKIITVDCDPIHEIFLVLSKFVIKD